MKTLLPVATALALVAAVNPLICDRAGGESLGLRVRNKERARSRGSIQIAGHPSRSGFRPQRVSARQLAVADRVFQWPKGTLHYAGSRG